MIKKIIAMLVCMVFAGCVNLPEHVPDEPVIGAKWVYESNDDDGFEISYQGKEMRAGQAVFTFSHERGASDIASLRFLRESDGARFRGVLDSNDGDFIPFMHWDKTNKQPYFKEQISENLWITTNVEDNGGVRIVNQTEYYGDPERNGTKARVISIQYEHGEILPELMTEKAGRVDGNGIAWTFEVRESLAHYV
jgi:hypothetical protein